MSLDNSIIPPRARRLCSRDRTSYRDAPYRKDRHGYWQDYLCKNCKWPGHFATECPNVAVCNNCGLPGWWHPLMPAMHNYFRFCVVFENLSLFEPPETGFLGVTLRNDLGRYLPYGW